MRQQRLVARSCNEQNSQRGSTEGPECKERRVDVDDLSWKRWEKYLTMPKGRQEGHRGALKMERRAWSWPTARETCTFTGCLRHNGNSIFSISQRRSGALLAVLVGPGQQNLLTSLQGSFAANMYLERSSATVPASPTYKRSLCAPALSQMAKARASTGHRGVAVLRCRIILPFQRRLQGSYRGVSGRII